MRRLVALLALTAALVAPPGALAAQGDLDGAFSADGLVSTPELDVRDTALAPDGSILAIGPQSNYLSYVARWLPNGDRDVAFGTHNGFSESVLSGAYGVATDLDIRGDGRIIAGGATSPSSMAGDFALAELRSDGTVACGAGDFCRRSTDFGADDRLYDIFAEPSGKTLAAGVSRAPAPAGTRLAVARYLRSGEPDESFAGDGKLLFETGGVSTFAESAAVAGLPDGSVLLAGGGPGPDGKGAGDALLAKLDPTGDLDATFGGGDGWLTIDLAVRDDVESLELGANGSIFLGIRACAFGLHTSCDAAIARITEAGELDAGWAGDGIAEDSVGTAIAPRSDAGAFVAGTTPVRRYFGNDFAVEGLNASGARETQFGGDGIATADFNLSQDVGQAVALTNSGGLVVSGMAGSTGYGIARFTLQGGPPDMDADDRLDDADRCPERFAESKSGCPSIDRRLELKTPGSRIRVKVRSELDLCRAKQRLKVVRLRRGPDKSIARPRTSRGGAWLSGRVPPGRYRVRADQKIAGQIGRCSSLRARPVRVG